MQGGGNADVNAERKIMRCVRRRRGLRLQWRDGRLARQAVWWPGETPVSPLSGFLELSFERVFGAVAGLREIAVGTVLHRVGVAMAELVCPRIVAGLGTVGRLFGALAAVGIVEKMVACTLRHGKPFEARASIKMNTGSGYAESSTGATCRLSRYVASC